MLWSDIALTIEALHKDWSDPFFSPVMSADKSEKPCIKQLGFGIGITVTANFCFLASSFIVREYPLNGGELCLSKGVLQVRHPTPENQQVSKLSSLPDYILHNYCVWILQEKFVGSMPR